MSTYELGNKKTNTQLEELKVASKDTAVAEVGSEAVVEHKPGDRVNLGVGLPYGLKEIIEAAAKEKNISGSAWTRDFLAEHFNYTLPESQRGGGKKKYATEEEKTQAREAAVRRRSALVKTLMARYKGDPEMQAEVDALVAAEIAAEAEQADGDEEGDETPVEGGLVGASS